MLEGLSPNGATDVIDQDVDAAILLVGLGHHPFCAFPGFQVGLHGQGFNALVAQLASNALHVVRDVHQYKTGTFVGGQFGHPPANALGGPRHYHHLVGEARGHATFSSTADTLGVNFS